MRVRSVDRPSHRPRLLRLRLLRVAFACLTTVQLCVFALAAVAGGHERWVTAFAEPSGATQLEGHVEAQCAACQALDLMGGALPEWSLPSVVAIGPHPQPEALGRLAVAGRHIVPSSRAPPATLFQSR